ncbi:MAG: hypothetical protein AB1443_05130 [Pseudomonadota bacterium]
MRSHALSIGSASAIAVVFAMTSWATCDWTWFQRSGTLIGVAGVLIESWQLIETNNPDDMPMWSTPESHSTAKVAIALGCVGALIQGYGDLIGRLG